MLVPAVFAVLIKMSLYLWDRIIEESLERRHPADRVGNLPT